MADKYFIKQNPPNISLGGFQIFKDE